MSNLSSLSTEFSYHEPRQSLFEAISSKLDWDRLPKVEKKGGSPGLFVKGVDSCSEGRGFESQHHILDGHFPQILVVKIVMFA